jgi:hypothetical protein
MQYRPALGRDRGSVGDARHASRVAAPG